MICPYGCGQEVQNTPPLRFVEGKGSMPQSSPPGVFWDREGNMHVKTAQGKCSTQV